MAAYPQSRSIASEPGFGRFIWNIFRCLSRRVLQRGQLIWEAQNLCVSGERGGSRGLTLVVNGAGPKIMLVASCGLPPLRALHSKEILFFFAETSPPSDGEHLMNCAANGGGLALACVVKMWRGGGVNMRRRHASFTCLCAKSLSTLCFPLSLKVQREQLLRKLN